MGDEPFLLTYGDGVSDIDPRDVIAYHKEKGGIVTITGVVMSQRFGVLDIGKDGRVDSFREKRDEADAFINGGFMVVEPKVFSYIGDDGKDGATEDFSSATLERLAEEGNITAYPYRGFWRCMDTQRDKNQLEDLWNSGNAPWKVW